MNGNTNITISVTVVLGVVARNHCRHNRSTHAKYNFYTLFNHYFEAPTVIPTDTITKMNMGRVTHINNIILVTKCF